MRSVSGGMRRADCAVQRCVMQRAIHAPQTPQPMKNTQYSALGCSLCGHQHLHGFRTASDQDGRVRPSWKSGPGKGSAGTHHGDDGLLRLPDDQAPRQEGHSGVVPDESETRLPRLRWQDHLRRRQGRWRRRGGQAHAHLIDVRQCVGLHLRDALASCSAPSWSATSPCALASAGGGVLSPESYDLPPQESHGGAGYSRGKCFLRALTERCDSGWEAGHHRVSARGDQLREPQQKRGTHDPDTERVSPFFSKERVRSFGRGKAFDPGGGNRGPAHRGSKAIVIMDGITSYEAACLVCGKSVENGGGFLPPEYRRTNGRAVLSALLRHLPERPKALYRQAARARCAAATRARRSG